MSDTVTLTLQVPVALHKRLKDAADRKSAAVAAVAMERLEASFKGKPGRIRRRCTVTHDRLVNFLVFSEVARSKRSASRTINDLRDSIFKDEKKPTLQRRYNRLRRELQKEGTLKQVWDGIRGGRDLVVTAGSRSLGLREAINLFAKGKAADLTFRELRSSAQKEQMLRTLTIAKKIIERPGALERAKKNLPADQPPLPKYVQTLIAFSTEMVRLDLDPAALDSMTISLGKK
jgi:hypothetical protein